MASGRFWRELAHDSIALTVHQPSLVEQLPCTMWCTQQLSRPSSMVVLHSEINSAHMPLSIPTIDMPDAGPSREE